MSFKTIAVLLLSIIGGGLYRAGGKGGFPHAKLIRRLGCPAVMLFTFWMLRGSFSFWPYVYAYILSVLAMTTYHDYLAPDGSEDWKCWLATGVFYSLSALPLLWCGATLIGLIARTAILSILIMAWSEIVSWDVAEEAGRGWLYIATIFLL